MSVVSDLVLLAQYTWYLKIDLRMLPLSGVIKTELKIFGEFEHYLMPRFVALQKKQFSLSHRILPVNLA